jgi:hypothetical protein
MTDSAHLRNVITGLIGFAATEEDVLLTAVGATAAHSAKGTRDCGDEHRWAALPTVAHNTEFREQQRERLRAVLAGHQPPAFGEIDHASPAVYARYAARSPAEVVAEAREVTAALVDGVRELAEEDLLDPSRHPWLNGRHLWLQVIVRGFWHPTGHVGEYYTRHGQPERAVALHEHALATARYLKAPDQAEGMAAYSLACAQCQAGQLDGASRMLAEAIALNPDVRVNAERDPDLAPLREARG